MMNFLCGYMSFELFSLSLCFINLALISCVMLYRAGVAPMHYSLGCDM